MASNFDRARARDFLIALERYQKSQTSDQDSLTFAVQNAPRFGVDHKLIAERFGYSTEVVEAWASGDNVPHEALGELVVEWIRGQVADELDG